VKEGRSIEKEKKQWDVMEIRSSDGRRTTKIRVQVLRKMKKET